MAQQPLAERLRPQSLDDYIGQSHLVGDNGVFRKFIASGSVPSFILWGPPGVGKTTLARIVANALDRPFYTLSAVTSGVKEVREVIDKAKNQHLFNARPAFLFIDEIHRFNKSQQDSLLGAVEQGIVTLIGATTENPSFEVISPLLSRCQVYVLKPMNDEELNTLLNRAISHDEELRRRKVDVQQTEALFRFSGGDARKLLNILDIIAGATTGTITIDDKRVTECLQQNIALYDKSGEQHYDVISAFIKSVRGSDPNAAIYYLARMLAGGEVTTLGSEAAIFASTPGSLLLLRNRGRGLEGHAAYDVLAVADAAQRAARVVGAGPVAFSVKENLVVVFAAVHTGRLETAPDFKALAGRNRKHGLGQQSIQTVEHGFAKTCRHVAHHKPNDPADAVAVPLGLENFCLHLGACRCIGAAHR